MDLLVMLILIGAVAAIIVYPLFRRSETGAVMPTPQAAPARTRLALAAIKELEFDYATGKIDDDDYRALRARYDARAVDALEHPEPRNAGPQPTTEDVSAQLEAEIRAARGRRFCTNCGGPLPKTARFCPACGTHVEVKA